ncbi:endonuclease domain-containing protein [Arabiibacter massiliensis]|uniref:endonuclease domain-containing protein n=1 Tax=Arabiibacter massiliensis TaxID=1870985 RepID=UPI0009BC33C0|nr:endonuclease domain-containing protein [Arabiibacter massiliensis]
MNRERRRLLAQRAEDMRRNMPFAERRLWLSFLREYPIPFVAQKVIGEYIVDFYCKRARLSIELDGDSHCSESQERYDRTRTTFLEMLEIKELRFTNEEVYENLEGVCEVIHNEVEKRRTDTSSGLFQALKSKS